eukprot:TRINITY_DN615_c0_g1_i8.p1 TRINITY_DN615_c0_g1~~TRINITY_DN615_c0_g1_i8.p1  ORF type:complete len:428 (-),score=71.38 TRINITY_DN615_c0_g1_i8:202-1485(-)
MRGNRYVAEFMIDQRKCDIFTVLAATLNVYEQNKESNNLQIKNLTSFKEGNVITIQLDFEESVGNPKRRIQSKGTIYITGEMTNDRPNFKFILEKTDEISEIDIKGFLEAYKEANRPHSGVRKLNSQGENRPNKEKGKSTSPGQKSYQEALEKLENFGVTIFMPGQRNDDLDWDYLAGYEKQKRDIEDTVLLALRYPEIYDDITRGTRMKFDANRPKAVLFEGPPGTGKTTSAKIIAQQVNIPLIYMPIESIMSKYYGESEKRFADIFEACKSLGKAIVFIDEIDAIAASRDEGIHEASRRVLSTLLRKIDSFESTTDVLLICATNRKQDLDAAMLSRIDLSIKFELPDKHSRIAIFQRYAKQLAENDLERLAEKSEGMSGRNISDICKDTERRWASKLIRAEVKEKLPDVEQYLESLNSRKAQSLA